MIFDNDRNALRGVFIDAWRRHLDGRPLDPLQAQVVAIVELHPEYHALLIDPDRALAAEFPPEAGQANPFLHMALHQAVREQVATDRPPGIAAAFRTVLVSLDDRHAAEHAVIDCLARMLWRTQRDGVAPDEADYLASIDRIGRRG